MIPPPSSRRASRLPTLTALASLVVALVAFGVAIAAWLRPIPENNAPPPPSEPTYTEQQIADAKAELCDAYRVVDRAVLTNTHRPDPVEGDEIGSIAVAANGRLALYAGGDYLLDRLGAEPATPADLSKAIRSLANTLKKLGMLFLADEPDSALDPLRHAVDGNSATIERLCE